ncbi:MAG: VOC family protein [Acidobacteriota bacterium]|nr:VOC family protein [Acidobacteriota bacterium]MYG75231.1 VOC family protein [Acidobacteriota bacterium]
MGKATHYIPNRANAVTPYLVVRDGQAALAWYQEVLGATVDSSMEGEGGAVMHAELRFGESQIYMAQEFPGPPAEAGFVSPDTLGGTSTTIHLYVPDVNAVHQKAVEEGAREIRPPEDQFWGDRMSNVVDPFGHRWSLATHIEDMTEEELEARAAAAAAEFEAQQ